MLPIHFDEANTIFRKPEGWTDEQCSDLSTWRGDMRIDEHGNTSPTIVSCWQLSKEDLEEINRTGKIWLSITGTGMPPVSLFTENPFIQQTTI
jgi:hypothetical protein